MIDVEKIEALAKGAIARGEEIGEESWYSQEEFVCNMLMHPDDATFAEATAPQAILALIAEVRELRNLEEAIRHDRAMFEGTSDEDNPMGVLVKQALEAIDAARGAA